MKLIDNIILKIDEFPTLPTIFSKLQDVMSNPRSNASDVADIISQDQSSASKILKIANAPIFGYKSQIKTITQAVVLLGQKELKNIIITLSIIDAFKGLKSNSYLNPVDLWKYSIATGVLSRNLAEKLGYDDIEEYFLSGILHSIGKLLYLKMLPQIFDRVITYSFDNQVSTKKTEKEIIGMSNNEAAVLLAEHWRLPRYVKKTVGNFEYGKFDGRTDKFISVVHISAFIVRVMKIGNPAEYELFNLNRSVLNELDFDDNIFTAILPKFYSQYLDAANLLLKI